MHSVTTLSPASSKSGARLTCEDGGGIRGVSELVILNELMLRIQAREKLDTTPKPCEIFDLIGGTSTGGLIAILLGRLGLPVDKALEEYGKLAEQVFSKKKSKGHEGMFYATALENAIKSVVRKYGNESGNADDNLAFFTDSEGFGRTKVSVPQHYLPFLLLIPLQLRMHTSCQSNGPAPSL